MGLIEKIIFYLAAGIGIILFLKLDSRISFINRLLIAGAAAAVLLIFFLFISAIITLVIVLVLVLLLVSFLERKNVQIKKFFKK